MKRGKRLNDTFSEWLAREDRKRRRERIMAAAFYWILGAMVLVLVGWASWVDYCARHPGFC